MGIKYKQESKCIDEGQVMVAALAQLGERTTEVAIA